jgi:hypothetical protein
VFWVTSVYFNIRNTLPKSGTFLLGHPVETCALKIKIDKHNILVLCVYRSPNRNSDCFINMLEKVFKFLHKVKTEYIVCGEFNVSSLNESVYKTQLLLLLTLI